MSAPLSNHDDVVQTLLQKLVRIREQCLEIRPGPKQHPLPAFVPGSKVKQLLSHAVVDSVLRAKCRTPLPVSVPSILQCCPRGLCILLEIGYGQYIPYFAQHPELRDDRLPLQSRPARFPQDGDIWEQFFVRQWEYFPVPLYAFASNFEETHVVPFLEKVYLVGGSTAKLYKVTLSREYDFLLNEESTTETGRNRAFALKTYKGQNAPFYFNNEVENFMRLHEAEGGFPPGLIGLHTSFQHGDTFNVLFELANGGNLEDMFFKIEPPATGRQIFEFWKALLEVLKALRRIHEIDEDPHDGGRKVFQGFHQDVKLKNILVFLGNTTEDSPDDQQAGPKYSFKLADLGISHFVLSTQGSQDVFAEDRSGSQTYGAPETFRETESDQRSRLMVTRSIDIWSLGCVLLVAAVWITYGSKGVRDFAESRREENEQNASQAAYSFHDGKLPKPQVLQVVRKHLSTLHIELRKSDLTTPEVLGRLVERMIDVDSRQRPTAATACGDATRALEAAKRNLANYYRTAEHDWGADQPLSPITPHALPVRYPSGPPPPLRHSRVDVQTPITPSTRDSSFQQSGSGRRGHAALWAAQGPGPEHRYMPETPTLARPRPPPGPRNSVPVLGATYSSPIQAHASPHIADVVSEEPADDDFDRATIDTQSVRPGHFPRHSDPSIPHEHLTHSPLHGNPFGPSPPRQNPYLSVDEATKFIHDTSKLYRFPRLENAHYRDFILGRDHIFLVDDSGSMRNHEEHVSFVAKVLLFFASKADRDGVDIFCANSERTLLREKKLDSLLDFVKSRIANGHGLTDIKLRLDSILSKYKGELELKEGKMVTKLSIYVLTDGAWTGLADVEQIIRETVKTLRRFNKGSSQLGIQFINFGDDADAIDRLERLDKLGKDPDVGLDIVDTTDHRGNVWKMLLGAFDKTFDEDSGPSLPGRSFTVPAQH